MSIRHKINTVLHTKRIFWIKLASSPVFRLFPDKLAISIIYHNVFGHRINLTNPQTYNEKLQWLKLYNRNPLYTKLVDKFAVKEWVAERIGKAHVIPTLGVWDSFDEIDFASLPEQFVLKTTHGGGNSGVVICRDKSCFDYSSAKVKLTASLKANTYIVSREWPYKDVPRRIIAERYVSPDARTNDLPDYKFFCFDGKVKALFVGTERQKKGEDVKFDFFDADFNPLPFRQGHDHAKVLPAKPHDFDRMKELAERLSAGFPHVRVDFYDVNDTIFFGELTFYHFGGMMPFEPDEWDYKFGEWLTLPERQ